MSEKSQASIVVVGAGHGGGNMVSNLRQAGHQGRIVLIGDELMVPYHRPPLSKNYLMSEFPVDTLKLRSDSFYPENDVELRLGRTAVDLDKKSRVVTLDNGDIESYDTLILATGSRARRLQVHGADMAGIYYLRSIRDADNIRDVIGPGQRLAIIGGGYVGLEVAASALTVGTSAVLIEREKRILSRVACEPLAKFFDCYHRARGLEIMTGAQIESIEGTCGRATGIRLADGAIVSCDVILVGIGGVACVDLAQKAGLVCDDGVVVDIDGQTSCAGIYAIGDMTRRPMPGYDNRMFRLESVSNAVEQARRAAAAIMGKVQPPFEIPWFWSDQYDLKLQIAGIPFDSHRLITRGSIRDGVFAIYHLTKGGRILAVEAVNSPQEFLAGRTLVKEGRIVADELLSDSSIPIKEIVKG